MYQKPNFVKVDINIKDSFANYTECMAIMNYGGGQFNTGTEACHATDSYYGISAAYGGPADEQCWVTRSTVVGS